MNYILFCIDRSQAQVHFTEEPLVTTGKLYHVSFVCPVVIDALDWGRFRYNNYKPLDMSVGVPSSSTCLELL